MTGRRSSSRLRGVIHSWIDSNDLAWMPPWSALGGNTREREVHKLRRHARRLIRMERTSKEGWPRVLTKTAFWPIITAIKTAIDLRERSVPFATSQWLREFVRIWWLQIFHNLRIADQVEYCLDTPERLHLCRSFLSCREQQILLQRAAEVRHGYPRLDEKRVFARFCKEHRLPHPTVLMSGEGSRAVQTGDWPAADLVLKPSDLCQGQGVEIISFDHPSRGWRAADGTAIAPQTLPGYAERRLGGHPWIVQARLVNPPSWRSLTPGPLATVRVVTGSISREAAPSLIGMHARFPIRNPFVDNVSAGGLSASIDPHSGRLRVGLTWGGGPRENATHPLTGGRIEGVVLPEWTDLRDLALRAHAAAGNWTSIGWDVASTTLGPMLIEANILWGAMSYVPQGRMPFVEIMQTAFGPDYQGIRTPPVISRSP